MLSEQSAGEAGTWSRGIYRCTYVRTYNSKVRKQLSVYNAVHSHHMRLPPPIYKHTVTILQYTHAHLHSIVCSPPRLPPQTSPWKTPVTPFEQPVRELSPESEAEQNTALRSTPNSTNCAHILYSCAGHKVHTGRIHTPHAQWHWGTLFLEHPSQQWSTVLCVCVCVHACTVL